MTNKQAIRKLARIQKLTQEAHRLATEIEENHPKGREIYDHLASNHLINAADAMGAASIITGEGA